MFSVQQKRSISDSIQKILRGTGHNELPEGEIKFRIHVYGRERWSWASIDNNGSCPTPTVNPFNEVADHGRSYKD